MRTHTCGELRAAHLGLNVKVAGWLKRTRDLGGLLFIDLRDRYGLVQIKIDPGEQTELAEKVRSIPRESVISVEGEVRSRPQEMINREMDTGEIEISPRSITVLSKCGDLPIPIEEVIDAGEDLRLKYRYLEMRRPEMQKRMALRHKLALSVRRHLDSRGFLEIETPYLMKSTPEGARDFLVPSRLHRGKFYALPQSPQTYKQILMVAGLDRYFQIVRCFRDEDFRADRQPEFTQIDMEMSFVRQGDVIAEVEEMMSVVFKEVAGVEVNPPFPIISYEQALVKYGLDKPDTRFGMELIDVTEIVSNSGFKVFDQAVETGGCVIAIPLENIDLSRKMADEVNSIARECGLPGVIAGKWDGGAFNTPLAKFLAPVKAKELAEKLFKENTGAGLFAAGDRKTTMEGLGRLRVKLSDYLKIEKKGGFHCLWVDNFPLFEYDQEGKLAPTHHPFTAPYEEDLHLLEDEPAKVRSHAYDLVINGYEIASGSIRIHRRDVQERIFRRLGIGEDEAKEKFGFLLEAFEYGVPPHGGIAFGFDRLLMIITGASSIREVIPFPKTTSGLSLMDGSPSAVSLKQLEELYLKVSGR